MMSKKTYTIKKSRKTLHGAYALFQKKKDSMSEPHRKQFENILRSLEDAIFDQDRERASEFAKQTEELSHRHFEKPFWQKGIELFFAILVALVIATVVRQTWFELYEIPTGSMRPSFREKDRLSVSKTAFGINIPLSPGHFTFDPDLVKRGKVVIFSGDEIPLPDTDTTYFGIFPYKKRYIKRMIGKPGDRLYFYGGKIYGLDKEGNPITELLDDPWMQKVEHIPFITFEGTASSRQNEILLKHMQIPVGKLVFSPFGGTPKGETYNGKSWIKDDPFGSNTQEVQTFGDLWGIKNFAMARLLNKEQLKQYGSVDPEKFDDAVLYLQLKHSPNLTYPTPSVFRDGGYAGVAIPAFESVIPLNKKHLDTLMKHLYTARFEVLGGRLKRYGSDKNRAAMASAKFTDIPDGTYEFTGGKAEHVGFQGITTTLPDDHPLYSRDPAHIQELFNMGMGTHEGMSRDIFFQNYFPNRYAYFRDGDLYLMGSKVIESKDPVLKAFLKSEDEKKSNATKSKPYLPFTDNGPPLADGEWDKKVIETFGLKVPEGHYLVLGDNHAMSADSRIFGFVPQENLEGAPSLLLWPPGERWGLPPQTAYPVLVYPRLIIWAIAGTIFAIWYTLHRRKMRTRLFDDRREP
jgi:signal peptidase I